MRLIVISLAAALVASPALADEQKSQTSDTQKSQETPGNMKGYGYGTQPGPESQGARQAGDPDRQKAPESRQDERAVAAQTGAHEITGKVVKASSKSLSLRDGDRVQQLAIGADTQVMREGKEIRASELQQGQEVRASFESKGGKKIATRITVMESAARQPPSDASQVRETRNRVEGGEIERRPQDAGATPDQK